MDSRIVLVNQLVREGPNYKTYKMYPAQNEVWNPMQYKCFFVEWGMGGSGEEREMRGQYSIQKFMLKIKIDTNQ